eukprot:TRINITY_DN40975_c0_g1_i1.p1 TRINITY_DN40975_c0_g1~~TRINITY_DN40975_c0_g1_i1.p1  ORF type:complete len:157 (-),score=20.93 TRINITY_DN40975_c0_g1_i1:8-454(-)
MMLFGVGRNLAGRGPIGLPLSSASGHRFKNMHPVRPDPALFKEAYRIYNLEEWKKLQDSHYKLVVHVRSNKSGVCRQMAKHVERFNVLYPKQFMAEAFVEEIPYLREKYALHRCPIVLCFLRGAHVLTIEPVDHYDLQKRLLWFDKIK